MSKHKREPYTELKLKDRPAIKIYRHSNDRSTWYTATTRRITLSRETLPGLLKVVGSLAEVPSFPGWKLDVTITPDDEVYPVFRHGRIPELFAIVDWQTSRDTTGVFRGGEGISLHYGSLQAFGKTMPEALAVMREEGHTFLHDARLKEARKDLKKFTALCRKLYKELCKEPPLPPPPQNNPEDRS